MEGSLDPFDFVLAESLHKTLDQLRNEMSNQEYHQWRAFYTYRTAMQVLEVKKAGNGRSRR
jgi:hypothetical protein